LQDEEIYTDTDSVIYIQKDDEPPVIECGDKLGSIINELQPGEFFDEFVSGNPKNYAYGLVNEQIPQRHRKLYVKSGL
jgi:hypothetical protein